MKFIYTITLMLYLGTWLPAQDPVVFANFGNTTATTHDNFVVFATLGTLHASSENSILISDNIAYYYQSGGTTAIHPVPMIEGLSIYPNPTTAIAILQRKDLQEKLNVRLHTSDGMVLLEKVWADEQDHFQFSLERYPAGIYLLSVTDEKVEHASRFRIIKQ